MEDASPTPTLAIVSVISNLGSLKALIVHQQPSVRCLVKIVQKHQASLKKCFQPTRQASLTIRGLSSTIKLLEELDWGVEDAHTLSPSRTTRVNTLLHPEVIFRPQLNRIHACHLSYYPLPSSHA